MMTSNASVIVLLDEEHNRILLCDRLRQSALEVSTDENGTDKPCDIFIVDAAGLVRYHEWIRRAKQAAEPIHLPCLLIDDPQCLSAAHPFFECADQVISRQAIDAQLDINIAIALRARQRSIALSERFFQTAAKTKLLEERYRLISELTSDYAYSFYVAPDGTYILDWVTHAFEQITGYTPDELNRRGWTVIVHPDDVPVFRHRKQALNAGLTDESEFRLVTKTGGIRWVRDHAIPVKVGGTIDRFYGAAKDITDQKAIQLALQTSEYRLRRVLETLPIGVSIIDVAGNVVQSNEAERRIWAGMHQAETGALAQYKGWRPESGEPIVPEEWATARAIRDGETSINEEIEIECSDNTRKTILNSAVPLYDEQRNIIGAIGVDQDISERKRSEENLRLWQRAIAASTNGVVIVEMTKNLPIVYVNVAFERITGYPAEEALGKHPEFLLGPDKDQPGVQEIEAALHELREGRAIVRNYRKDGQSFWSDLSVGPVCNGAGRVTHFIGIQNDVTERKKYEVELEYRATHDALTRLPNRNLLRDRLHRAVLHANRDHRMAAVLFIDLDRFKIVNDSMGHDAGDQMLCQVSDRLLKLFREGDTVARQGGDEFVVVIERIDNEEEAADLSQRLMQAMAAPFQIAGRELYASCSIGIAVYPKDGAEATVLLKNADAAMYRAKDEGRNVFRFYETEMNARAHLRLELEAAMRGAIGRNELVLHYQPQIDLVNGQLIGFEALVRWQHPELGLLPPGQFIGVAEETGAIVQIGEWVLREACRQAKWWHDHGLGKYFVAVNLSARQFGECNLMQLVDTVLEDVGLDAQYLELEITESLLMENPEAAADTLHKLRARGVHLSIDDFGTGYSSLSYLKRFSLDKLKIDRSFVRDITIDPDDAAIATAIIAMAHRLKLKVIAEGVETEDQLSYLRSHHCDEMQGFLFSKPLPADECECLLRTRPVFDLPPGQQVDID